MDQLIPFEGRIRQIRADEGGSVMLLSSMMAFLIAISAFFTFNTSRVIYNRIMAQNAVDAAAMTSALWQARGENMLQNLNNLHYDLNQDIYVAEWADLMCCYAVPGDVEDEIKCCEVVLCPCCCLAAAIEHTRSDCASCNNAGSLNDQQSSEATTILDAQNLITTAMPLAALYYANLVAQAAGADPLNDVLPAYVGQIGQELAQVFGMSLSGSLPNISVLPNIYALPMQLFSQTPSPGVLNNVFLNAQETNGQNWPWKWNQNVAGLPFMGVGLVNEGLEKDAAWVGFEILAKPLCALHGVSLNDHDSTSKWGWDDSYYAGYPGFTTWIAGKTNQPVVLGNLRWFNGGSPPASIDYPMLGMENLPMYTGEATSATSPLQIPAIIALASSQVQGTGLVAKDTGNFIQQAESVFDIPLVKDFDQPPIDSVPKLISVFLPSGTPGTDYLIYH